MKLWMEKTGAQEAAQVQAGDQVRRRCVLGNQCIFEEVSDAPAPTMSTVAGRRIWLESDDEDLA